MKFHLVTSLATAALFVGCASSSSRLIAPARPPISPTEVRLYYVAPPHYEQIAALDATSGGRLYHGTPAGEAEALQRLKEEAAKIGANGVLVTLVGDRSNGAIGVAAGGDGIAAGRRSFVTGGAEVSGGAPIVSNAASGIAIYVPAP